VARGVPLAGRGTPAGPDRILAEVRRAAG
jgi:hypothetical protein